MNRILTMWTLAILSLPAATLCAAGEVFPVVHDEPILVRVLGGKDGKPQARTHVVLVAGFDRRDLELAQWKEEAVTDSAGTVRLSNGLRNLPLLRVVVLKRHACSAGGSTEAFSVERIRRDGLSGTNRCGTPAVEDAPGMFTVFVKGGKAAAKNGKTENQAPAQASLRQP